MSDDIKEDKGTTKLDKVANRFDKFLNSMDTFESNLDSKVTKLGQKAEKTLKPLFVKALMLAGFSEDTINGLKQSINMVSYKSLSEMDKILEKTSKNKDEPIKGNEDKGEDYNDR